MRGYLHPSLRWLLAGMAVIMLAGCQSTSAAVAIAEPAAGLPQAEGGGGNAALPAAFGVLARFTLQLEGTDHAAPRRFAGGLDWSHTASDQQQLLLTGPFGQGLAEIEVTPAGARLRTRNGQVIQAETAAGLLHQQLGYPLPLGELRHWLFGQGSPQALRLHDAAGRTRQLRDQGWIIDYRYADSAADAPAALRFHRPVHLTLRRDSELELQLSIESWQD